MFPFPSSAKVTKTLNNFRVPEIVSLTAKNSVPLKLNKIEAINKTIGLSIWRNIAGFIIDAEWTDIP